MELGPTDVLYNLILEKASVNTVLRRLKNYPYDAGWINTEAIEPNKKLDRYFIDDNSKKFRFPTPIMALFLSYQNDGFVSY